MTENMPVGTTLKMCIILPDGIEMATAQDKVGHYDAVQRGDAGDYDSQGWFDLRRAMENAGYALVGTPYWNKGAWHGRFKPAPYRPEWLRKSRQWLQDWTRPAKGSPRAMAPRFDGEFFGNWVRRLTALGVFSTILAVLVHTIIRLDQIRLADPQAWAAAPAVSIFHALLFVAQILVICLLIAITLDLAHYTARRLYRLTGWDVLPVTFMLAFVILLFGAGLFITAESARQIISDLDRQSATTGN